MVKKKQAPAKKQASRPKSAKKAVRSQEETPFVKGTVMTITVLSVIFFLLVVNKYGLL